MASDLARVPIDQVRSGDILWWPGHVGIYTGEGWMVDALDRRHGVVMRRASSGNREARLAFRPY
jgi:hypothetical protein